MILSTVASNYIFGSGKKKAQRRESSCNRVMAHRPSIPSTHECSIFEDSSMVIITPLTKLINKIRRLEQLTPEDIEYIRSEVPPDTCINLLLEYNLALRFRDVAVYHNK